MCGFIHTLSGVICNFCGCIFLYFWDKVRWQYGFINFYFFKLLSIKEKCLDSIKHEECTNILTSRHLFLITSFLLSVENRSALRDLDGINKLIEFLTHSEWSDLHVMVVMVLSNLLEDIESLEVRFKAWYLFVLLWFWFEYL